MRKNLIRNPEVHMILLICAICVATIVGYGTFRCKHAEFTDPLTWSPFDAPLNSFFDGWGVLHFLFYAALAYMFPGHLVLIFLLGLAWEAVETVLKDHPFYISKCNAAPLVVTTDGGGTTEEKAPWWYGRWQDIVMNTAGIIVGYHLTKRNFFKYLIF